MTRSRGTARFGVGILFALAGLIFVVVSFFSRESSSGALGAVLLAVGAVLMGTSRAAANRSHPAATAGRAPEGPESRVSSTPPGEP